jgi:hypothetical protein
MDVTVVETELEMSLIVAHPEIAMAMESKKKMTADRFIVCLLFCLELHGVFAGRKPLRLAESYIPER